MVTTRYADNNGVRLSYRLHDPRMFERPHLLLVQGVGFDADAWAPVLRRLREGFRLVVLDNRGAGASDAAHGWYGVSTMVEDVVAVLDAENIPSAHVLGVSLGGMVAQELAIRHPHRVERLVLVSTTPGWPSSYPMPGPTARLLAVGPILPRRIVRRRQTHTMMSRHSMAARPDLRDQVGTYLSTLPHDPVGRRRQMMAGAAYVGGRRQSRIRAETLVLHGSRDTVVDPRNATVLANRIPAAELVVFPDAGHLLFWEHPARFCEVVTAFLESSATDGVTSPSERPGAGSRRRVLSSAVALRRLPTARHSRSA